MISHLKSMKLPYLLVTLPPKAVRYQEGVTYSGIWSFSASFDPLRVYMWYIYHFSPMSHLSRNIVESRQQHSQEETFQDLIECDRRG